VDTKVTRAANLIGKGGIGLVMFHLARLGWEFAQTFDNSNKGDIWVHVGDSIVSLEVKSGFANSWIVSKSQLDNVDFYCFVEMNRGICYLLKSSQLKDIIKKTTQKGVELFSFARSAMPFEAEENWKILAGSSDLEYTPAAVFRSRKKPAPRRQRVKKILADGTVKIYEYGYTEKPEGDTQT
jgi:hypothetical protein